MFALYYGDIVPYQSENKENEVPEVASARERASAGSAWQSGVAEPG
ncbi:MAG: hypothetical protein OXF86_01180 [Caldilineaceae bacterium]|nr:hypothetical protein [Caldilineaceae bacterium]